MRETFRPSQNAPKPMMTMAVWRSAWFHTPPSSVSDVAMDEEKTMTTPMPMSEKIIRRKSR